MRLQDLRKRMAFVGAAVVLAAAEVGVRIAAPMLPEPVLWPSMEADIKASQMNDASIRSSRIVFIGDSTMESGVDPTSLSELGIDAQSYNAALPWSTPLSMELWFGQVVRPLLHPKVVFVGLVPPSLVGEGEGDVLYHGLLTALESEEQSLIAGLAGWSELYRNRTLIRDLPAILRRERVMDLGLISTRGFQAGYVRGAISVGDAVVPAIDNSENPMPDHDVAALSRLIIHAKDEAIKVVLVVEPLPCPADWGDCVNGFRDSVYYRQLESLALATDVPLLNSMEQSWPTSLFVDDRHLNAQGVDRFERLMASAIVDLASS